MLKRLAAPLLLLASLLIVPTPAQAATGRALTAAELAQVRPLTFTSTLAARDTVAATLPVTKVSMSTVIGGGYTTRAICHPTNLRLSATVTGFCWNTTDDTTANWFPQGITGSGDGVNGSVLYPPCEGCAGRKIVAVSWRSGASHEYGANRLARVTFVDVTAGTAGAPYRHALLVEPDGSAEGFREIASHADGISWYGNKLFLVTGGDPDVSGGDRLVRVFDLTHFWRMSSTTSGNVGCAGGVCSAAFSGFALPQIGYYRLSPSAVCASLDLTRPCLNGVSLDRSGTDHLTTVEYRKGGSGGKILRWPLDAATALLRTGSDGLVRPTEGWFSPVWDVQGGVFTGGRGVLVGLCPEGSPSVTYMPGGTASVYGEFRKSCLHRVTLSADRATLDVHYLTTAPGNAQNVSYWPASGEMWLVNEFRGDYDGVYDSDRLVLAVTCPNLDC
ncbi:putative secreted protein [[Actinomadura] parvosata subsp. kistnae]|uniref:Secreted protein n=1 Tax=[Actinomadura] parvosata subsp. kistnae TaxID=1909395 RepID=A0A1U9ZUT7_9ACTN|nr:hypothetical protein [Nonomuraea sp. ATCC 55076]AQZ61721.1 hypothetical protein BKM31_09770 [Nonomuraea sp. ATCC 55076]SPL87833.1 putative secreted protein [Actinomadura parvosata subsp. kistnae]